MTSYRAVQYHEIPDAYRAMTLARAEEIYGRPEPDAEYEAWLDEEEERIALEEWQNDRAEQADRFVDESDVADPWAVHILAANGHVYHVSPAVHTDHI